MLDGIDNCRVQGRSHTLQEFDTRVTEGSGGASFDQRVGEELENLAGLAQHIGAGFKVRLQANEPRGQTDDLRRWVFNGRVNRCIAFLVHPLCPFYCLHTVRIRV
jgi:hypothetical protein